MMVVAKVIEYVSLAQGDELFALDDDYQTTDHALPHGRATAPFVAAEPSYGRLLRQSRVLTCMLRFA